MGLSDAGLNALKRFAVYCGDGVFVRRAMGRQEMLDKFGIIGCEVEMGVAPVAMRRDEAVAACRAVRSMGGGAWIVAHGVAA